MRKYSEPFVRKLGIFSKEIYVIYGIGVRHRQVEGLGIGAKVMNWHIFMKYL